MKQTWAQRPRRGKNLIVKLSSGKVTSSEVVEILKVCMDWIDVTGGGITGMPSPELTLDLYSHETEQAETRKMWMTSELLFLRLPDFPEDSVDDDEEDDD